METGTTRVYLARHGGTTASSADRFAGSSNVQLSEAGREQARRLGARLAAVPIDAAYCSSMQRAVDTAMPACTAHGLTPVPMVELREIDHGHWEGQTHDQVVGNYADEYARWSADPLTYAPPGGETGLSVLARAMPAVRWLVERHPGGRILIVSHTGTNRLLLCALLGIDPRRYRDRLTQDLACLNVLEFKTPTEARAVFINDTSHLASG
jgi:broad specificity phosphatase PhoE